MIPIHKKFTRIKLDFCTENFQNFPFHLQNIVFKMSERYEAISETQSTKFWDIQFPQLLNYFRGGKESKSASLRWWLKMNDIRGLYLRLREIRSLTRAEIYGSSQFLDPEKKFFTRTVFFLPSHDEQCY